MLIRIVKDSNWDGHSKDPATGIQHPNKETAMDWAEHVAIVTKAKELVASPNTPAPFRDLRLAYGHEESKVQIEIIVLKGIHQPTTNPHIKIQTRVPVANNKPRFEKYHLNVSAKPAPGGLALDDKFQWVGVQFTQGNAGENKWPIGAPITMKEPAAVLTRRNSISSTAYAARVAEVQAEAKAAAMQKELNDKFEAACVAFENLHNLEPIDRAIRTAKTTGWTKPVYSVASKAAGQPVVKFTYDPMKVQFSKQT